MRGWTQFVSGVGNHPGMAMNIKEVAKRARVSIATVSRTVNFPHLVHPRTAERVRKAVAELNYRPNLTARALKTGRTHLVGLIVPDLVHSFFAELARGLSSALRPEGFSVVISSSEEDAGLEAQAIDHLLARGVDALLIASVQQEKEIFEQVERRHVPYILVDRTIPGLAANFVGVEDDNVGFIATEHLLRIGCKRIAHIRGARISTALGRLEGYKAALRKHGLPVMPEYVINAEKMDESADSAGYEAALKLLALDSRPDGIFCFNDPLAIGVMKALLERGIRIPQEIALIGSGNLHFDSLLRVPLSTVDQCSELIGERAAELAIQLIKAQDAPKPRTIYLPPRLVVRDSARREA
ncbi:MAG TPA: LacI family DNA-binding transcriptional regulator [Terriglobales bacterium]|jgi:LacI family transcriptional regulator